VNRLIRAGILAGSLAAGSLGVAGCHQPADVTCEYFNAHASDVLKVAYWEDLPDNGGSYDRGRYRCVSWHENNPALQHHFCVYAPEHSSPPDNVYSVDRSCP
jgi:hypothetical protein